MKHIFNRILAVLLIALMLAEALPCALAETDVAAESCEVIFEEPELSLEEALGLLPGDIPAYNTGAAETTPETTPETTLEPTQEPTQEPTPEPEGIEGWETIAVSDILTIGSETFTGVNFVRAGGYEGPIAKVYGKLKLDNVLIDGVPAGETDIAAQFELVTGATVAITKSASLIATVDAVSIDKGAKKTLKLKWKGKTLKASSAKWKSSDKSIVTVSKEGKIKGVAKGVATITATYKKRTAAVRVVVTEPVTKVTMTPAVKYIEELTQQQFTAEAFPAEADYPALTWKSSNPAIATVDESGLVSALVPGTATITASAVNGKYAAVKLQVIRPAQEMTLPEAVRVNIKKTKTLKPAFVPADTSLKSCTWTTSDKSIATVSKKGVVTGKGVGTCVITATSHNGIESQCTVTVVRPVTSLKMSKKELTLSLNHTGKLKAKISPSNATIKTLAWTSSDPSVVTVDENGNLQALKKGTATIRAKAYNGKSCKCKVTVKEFKPTSLNFSHLFVTLNPGDTFQSTPSIKPSNTSNKQVIYSSSNTDVATVDENGLVTAVGVGRATITGKCAAKSKVKNTYEISVIEAGSARFEGLVIGLNPGHQTKTIFKKYPLAPGSKETGYGCKVGAVGRWTRIPEYKTVLAIGKKLAEMLTEEGATVVMTRTSNNVSLSNIQRAEILNKAGVDVALQLHCNSSTNTTKNGISTFYRTTGSWVAESKSLAKILAKQMSNATGLVNKGPEAYNGYMSLNYSKTPAVLLEMGYLSNKKEDKLLATDECREQFAIGIREGLAIYFDRQ